MINLAKMILNIGCNDTPKYPEHQWCEHGTSISMYLLVAATCTHSTHAYARNQTRTYIPELADFVVAVVVAMLVVN